MIFFRKLFLLFLIASALPLNAQNLDELIQRYTGDNVDGYVNPLITGLGANLNSGYFVGAYVPKTGFHLDLRVNAMAAFFSDEQRTFMASTEGFFVPVQTAETSTIVGDGTGTTVNGDGNTSYTFPGGYDLSALATITPTLTIGSVLGTDAAIRYLSVTPSDDVGELRLFGLGLRHSISQYIPNSPVDLAAGFAYTDLKLGSIIDINQTYFHAEVGKRVPFFQVFGGLGIESNSTDIEYTPNNGTEEIKLELTGDNKFRVFAGFAFDLYILHISMDYSMGSQQVLNTGVSFGL
ncbi:MAG: DUF6588 family protein [Calditrichia bacterium]